ncbi:MAG: aspartate kinase [Thermoplasmatota archaeon]
MRVMKFGGASMGTAPMIDRVVRIVKDTPGERLVVVSAMSGVTDSLVATTRRVQRDEGAIEPFLTDLRRRHGEALEQLGTPDAEAATLDAEFDRLFQRLERLFYGIAYTEELTGKSLDLALSFGERLAARVLASALRSRGQAAIALDADNAGILTDGVFGNASPNMPAIEKNLRQHVYPILDEGAVPVLTGFFGVDPQGHVTTFGRGGSDYSAALAAAALEAERLEVWKDVDGFLTADPRILKDARVVNEMTYDEAAELAYVGAKVLHPRTVEPLKPKGIPIYVKSMANPDAPGTRIAADEAMGHTGLRSCAHKDGLGILRLYGPGMAYTPGVGKRIFSVLGDAKVNVYNMAASQASLALLINNEDVERGAKALEAVRENIFEHVDAMGEMSLICVVGRGIGATPGTAGRIFAAVGQAGVNVEMISVGASDIALNFVIRGKDRSTAIRAIHDAFLSEETS